MIEKLQTLWPEITLLTAACVVMILGLSRNAGTRKLCAVVSAAALVIAGILALSTPEIAGMAYPHLARFGKVLTAAVGLLLLLLIAGTADREYEVQVSRGEPFDPLRAIRGEFYAFFLFSLTGLMLCCGADDLIWLFLALELVSLPTYIMVAVSRNDNRAMEAGVKYFFLGALGAAFFLYGFAMLYGATGTTNLRAIGNEFKAAGSMNPIATIGVILSLVGVSFKIAAVPMHFYAADVYQGASSSVSAFLAFVPKTAGFLAIIGIASTMEWTISPDGTSRSLPEPIHITLWIMAAVTMTVGNVLALRQTSVKRMLAYSSIAHSGYMLVGIIAGPGTAAAGLTTNGIAAVLFYLVVYGVTNLGAFAVLACLQRASKDAPGGFEEADSIEDIRGLCHTRPLLGWTMVICSMSLLGLPPLLGFFGKLPLFGSGLAAGQYSLVVVLAINSAIAAVYYLRLASTALLESTDGPARSSQGMLPVPVPTRGLAGALSAMGAIALVLYPVSFAVMDAVRGDISKKVVHTSSAASSPVAEQSPIVEAAATPR